MESKKRTLSKFSFGVAGKVWAHQVLPSDGRGAGWQGQLGLAGLELWLNKQADARASSRSFDPAADSFKFVDDVE